MKAKIMKILATVFLVLISLSAFAYIVPFGPSGSEEELRISEQYYEEPGYGGYGQYAGYPGQYSGYPDYSYYDHGNYGYYNTPYKLGDCFNLNIVSENVGVETGRLATARLFLKNFSRAPFYIDTINVSDNSPAFDAVPVSSLAVAYPESRNGIELEVSGYPVRVTETGAAVVSITGHYPNGKICRSQEEFFVTVNAGAAEERRLRGDVKVEAPSKLTVEGNEAVGEVTVSNSYNYPVTIEVAAENADVEPRAIVVGPQAKEKRLVKVAFKGEKAKVVFNVRSTDVDVTHIMPKAMVVEKAKLNVEPKPVAVEIANVPKDVTVVNRTEVPITVINTSDEHVEAFVTLAGLPEQFSVREKVVSLLPHETMTVPVEVLTNNADEGSYTADVVVKTMGAVRVGKVMIKVSKEDNVAIDAKVEPVAEGASLVKLKIKNNLKVPTTALVSVEAPEGVQVEGSNVALEMDSGDEKEVAVKVTPLEPLKEDLKIKVKVKTPDGKEAVKDVTLVTGNEVVRAAGTAMVAFSAKAVNLGVIGILVLLLYFVYRRVTSGELPEVKRNGNGKNKGRASSRATEHAAKDVAEAMENNPDKISADLKDAKEKLRHLREQLDDESADNTWVGHKAL